MTPLTTFLSRYLPQKWVLPVTGLAYTLVLFGVVLLLGYESKGPQILYLDLGR